MKKLSLFLLVLFFSAEVFAQPLPPTDLTAVQTTQHMLSVKLSWTPPAGPPVYFSIYKKNGALNDTIPFVKRYTHIYNTVFYDRQVQPGHTYSYYVTAYNMQGESDPSNAVEITLTGGGGTLTGGKIAGQIVDGSTNLPIPFAKAYIVPLQSFHGFTAMTDSNGFFVKNVPEGTYIVRFMAMGYISEFYDNAPTPWTAQQIVINENDSVFLPAALAPYIPPTLYTVAGSVTDSAGNPLMARIHAYRVFANTEHLMHNWAITDSLGNYTLNVRENDTIVVFARPFDFNYLPEFWDNKPTFAEADRIVVAGNITGINFVLDPKPVYPNGITGTVKNSGGEPVPSFVSAFRNATDHLQKRRYTTVTDTFGVYGFNNMIPGEYILLACPKQGYSRTYFRYDGQPTLNWYEADSVVVTDNGIVPDINFTVVPLPYDGMAIVTGTAYDDNGTPLNGVHIFAVDVNRQIFTYALTDADGKYVLNGLQPGEYELYSDKIDYTSANARQIIISSILQDTQADFILTPYGVTEVDDNTAAVTSYELCQNYPNPFNPSTTIKYTVPEQGLVKLVLYDMLGREVKTLVNDVVNAGSHSVQFDAGNLSTGVYMYKLQSGNFTSTKKLMLLK